MNHSVVQFCRLATRVAGVLVALVGAMGLIGWIFNVESLKAFFTGAVTIKANAAIGLILLGTALIMLAPQGDRSVIRTVLGRGMAGVAMLLGGLTLIQHITGADFAIDQLLFQEMPGAAATAKPGRMGPPASLSYFFAGLALLFLDVRTARGAVPSQWLALLVGFIAMGPIIGYAYSIQSLYGIARYTGIAMHTALAILALAVGLLTARPTAGLMAVVCADDIGGVTARRLLLPAILLPFTLGWLRTIGERQGLFDNAFGRPILILSVMASMTAFVWWTARSLSTLGRQRTRAEEERRQGELALRSSEQQMRLLTDVLPALISYIGADCCFRFNNRAYLDWFGTPPAELAGKHLRDVLGEEDYRELLPRIEQVLRGEVVRFEAITHHHEKGAIECEMLYVPDIGADGRVVGFVVLGQDIAERKRAETALRRHAAERELLLENERAARAEAERASEAKSQFLATLSHELRTPLTPVLLTVSLMESHPQLPADLRGDVAMIRKNVELESRLISDLLDITRITRGKLQLDLQDVDLHLIVRSALDICQREASATVRVNWQARVCNVKGDSTRLQQIFWNLINNAMKFTPANGSIEIRAFEAAGERIAVEVIDSGEGIDPAVLPKLFNAFEQGEVRAGNQFAGLGLGLAISQRLAEAHGGRITASSDGRGKGATFRVELPLAAQAPGNVEAPAPTAASGAMQPLNVLLVEDHDATLAVLTRMLRQMGHRVTGAKSVKSGAAAARQDTFDLIISDIGLPDGSGLDLMKELRTVHTGQSIALTGYGMEEDVRASRNAGFAEHLTKPVDMQALRATIGRVMERS